MSEELDITVVETVSDSEMLVVLALPETQPVIVEAPETPTVVIAGNTPAADGISAYQVALNNGFVGTESQWLASLKGNPGNDGAAGSAWHQGAGVPTDVTGVNGDYYFRTATSDIYRKASGAWGTPIANIKGEDGTQGPAGQNGTNGSNGAAGSPGTPGADGSTWYTGTDAPSDVLGIDGDYYLRSNGNVYEKTSGSWGLTGINLKGNDGAPGVPGSNGNAGADGHSPSLTWSGDQIAIDGTVSGPHLTGPTGSTGSAGTNGTNGTNGADGAPGPNQVTTSTATNVTGILAGDGSHVKPAVAGDFPTLNQNTSGNAAGLSAQYIDWNATSGGPSIANKPTIPSMNTMRGRLSGFAQALNGTTSLDVGVGWCVDSTNTYELLLSSTLTKTKAAWAVGNNQGGLDTGSSYTNSTWYYVFAIKRLDTGVVDVLFSTSATSPTLPTNYTVFRRIGAFYSNSSGVIQAFTNQGDYWYWTDSILDLNTTTPANTWTLVTCSVPRIQGIIVIGSAIVRLASTTIHSVGFSSGIAPDPSQRYTGDFEVNNYIGVANAQISNTFQLQTNSSGQVKYMADATSDMSVFLRTKGWIDTR